MRLLISGGGTGGHVYPGVAVARELLSRGDEHAVLFVGGDRGAENNILPREGLPLKTLSVSGIKGKGLAARFVAVMKLIRAVVSARSILRQWAPDAVLGVGGYASGAIGIAAVTMRIPLFVAEQNARPGLTNRWLAKSARQIFTSWPGGGEVLPMERVTLTGNPARPAFFETSPRPAEGVFSLFVFGGSQGARTINDAVIQALPALVASGVSLKIVHQTGPADYERIVSLYDACPIPHEVAPFFHDMPRRLAEADLVVCRSGAGAVSEICAAGRGALYVPYPHAADDHQTKNAEVMVKAGAAELVADRYFNGAVAVEAIIRLAKDRRRLKAMGEAARAMARPHAAKDIVDAIINTVAHRRAA